MVPMNLGLNPGPLQGLASTQPPTPNPAPSDLWLLLPTAFFTPLRRLYDPRGTQALGKAELAAQHVLGALGVVCQLVDEGVACRSNPGPCPAPEPAGRELTTLLGLMRSGGGLYPRWNSFLQRQGLRLFLEPALVL